MRTIRSTNEAEARQKPVAIRMNTGDWARLVLLSLPWGATFFFAKIALVAMPPLTLTLLRVSIAALVLLLILKASRIAVPATRGVWTAFFGIGLLNNVLPFSLIFWGQNHLPKDIAASLAAILNATTPIFGVLVAHGLTRDEKLTVWRLIGVCLGFLGVAVMIAPRLFGHAVTGEVATTLVGVLACLTASFIYGLAGIFGRRFKAMGLRPVQIAFGQVAASSCMMLVVAGVFDHPWTLPMPGAGPILAVLGVGIVSTALPYMLYFQILASAGATNLLLVTFLVPISAILLSSVFLDEHLTLVHAAGISLIGLGLAAIDGRMIRLFKAPDARRPARP